MINEINRSKRGITLTDEDAIITASLLGEIADYSYAISDRNDAAIMSARSILTHAGCRATCKNVMPA